MITDENNNLPTTSSLNRSKDLHLDRSKKKVLLNTPISPVSRTNFFSKKKTIDINSRFIKIWIENLIGTAYEVFILPDEQIFNLKLKLEKEENIPLLYQTLYYGDDELNDSFTIEEYGIEYGATLRLQVQETKEVNKNQFESNNEPTFSIDEKTYNLLFDDTDAKKKKCSSLTDSKSIDEFRLMNASSNLGCISVNGNAFISVDDTENERNSDEKQTKMEQLLIKMQKWSTKKESFKLPYLANDDKLNELHNKEKRLSSQLECSNRKNFNFDSRFRSNSSFNLITDYEQNKVDSNNEITKSELHKNVNRRSSIPLIEKKQIFKLKLFDTNQKLDQTYKDNQNSQNVDQNKKSANQKQIKNNKDPLPRIKLPPVNKKKVQKCSNCKKKLNIESSFCKCEQASFKSDNDNSSIQELGSTMNAFKKKLLPKI